MKKQPTREQLFEELKQLYQTRGGKLWGSWRALENAWFVLSRNRQAILESEEMVKSRPDLIAAKSSNAVLTEMMRYLHNFLASAVTVDDQVKGHVHRFYRRQNKSLLLNYQSHREQMFQREPVCALVRVLRNVSLHFALPEILVHHEVAGPLGEKINDPGTTTTIKFRLDCAHTHALIKAADRRRNRAYLDAIGFLKTLNDDIPLTDIAERYISAFETLHKWLSKVEHTIEGSAVDEYISKYNEIVAQLYPNS